MNIRSKFSLSLHFISIEVCQNYVFVFKDLLHHILHYFVYVCVYVFYSTKRTTNISEVQKRELNKRECPQAFVFIFSRLLAYSIDQSIACKLIAYNMQTYMQQREDTMNKNKKPSVLKIIIVAFIVYRAERARTQVNVLFLLFSSRYSLHHHDHALLLLRFIAVVDKDVIVVIIIFVFLFLRMRALLI